MAYIHELIEKMGSTEELAPSEVQRGESTSVAFRAYREAEEKCDLGMLPEIQKLNRKRLSQRNRRHLIFITACLISNTSSLDAKNLFMSFEWEDQDSYHWDALVAAATKARLVEYSETVALMMEQDRDSNDHFESCIEFFEKVIGASAVGIIGRALDNDCWGRSVPFFCCVALGNIGHKDGIPFLERAAKRHAEMRNQLQVDAHSYARSSIEKILSC